MDEAAALPSPRVLLSRRLKRYYGRLRLPPGTQSTSRLSTGYRTGRSDGTHPRGRRAGEGLPSSRRHPLNVPSPHTPGGSSGPQSRLFTPSMAFAVTSAARLLLFPPAGGVLTTRQASHNASDRSVAPSTGLLTLRFDPGRFPPKPAACYRASWQLPGPDLPRLATTSLCWISYPSAPPTLDTPRIERDGGHVGWRSHTDPEEPEVAAKPPTSGTGSKRSFNPSRASALSEGLAG